MRTNSWIPGIVIAGISALLWACPGSSDPTTDSQTNWLSECQSASDCESGLDCVCGTCTFECTDADGCDTPGPSVCAPAESVAVTGQCGATATESICLPECLAASDCGTMHACVGGFCVPDAGQGDPDPDVTDVGEDPDADDAGSDPTDDASEDPDVDDTSDVSDDPDVSDAADVSDDVADTSDDTVDTSDAGDVDCGDLVLPDSAICGDANPMLRPILGDDGCPFAYACIEEGCTELPNVPDCDLGGGEIYRETAAACPDWECLAAGTFPCGDVLNCTLGEEYCDVFVPGVMGSENQYTCQPLPDVCAIATRCSCLQNQVQSEFPEADCAEIGETGGFSWTVYAP